MTVSYARLAELRHRLSLPVLRQVSGAIEGQHRSIFTGHGQDFDDMVAYRPGDDVSDIDWKASARAGQPIIRRFVKETTLQVILAVDTSAAMRGTCPDGQPKIEVAIDLVDVLAYLARMRSDLLALVLSHAGRVTQLPPRSGTDHLELVRHTLRRAVHHDDAASSTAGPGPSVASDEPDTTMIEILERAEALARRRSLVVIVGDDWSLSGACEDALKRLRVRHEVLFFSIADVALADLAGQRVVDVADGPLPSFVTTDRALLAEAAEEESRNRARVRELLRSLGIRHARVAGSEDVIDVLLDLFGGRGQ
ncbi:MAG: DUF58 domain-containing protein [Bowdeniella nasicola]|nr:DUF58 domain-containing protein [Bowdeniella nasicola]